MDRIGVRELRQNASRYLKRVREGETIEVTSRGEPVARLTPVRSNQSVRDRLITEGKLIPGRGRLDELGPPLEVELTMTSEQALDEQRQERL